MKQRTTPALLLSSTEAARLAGEIMGRAVSSDAIRYWRRINRLPAAARSTARGLCLFRRADVERCARAMCRAPRRQRQRESNSAA